MIWLSFVAPQPYFSRSARISFSIKVSYVRGTP
jgi:hypothetical protein